MILPIAVIVVLWIANMISLFLDPEHWYYYLAAEILSITAAIALFLREYWNLLSK